MAVNTVARSKQDVDSMSAKDRLWDSLNYSYGEKREASDKAYDKLASQTNNQLLSRGMQRSSYGAQTVANVGKQKVDAQNQIYNEQIADYENRLYQIERDEKTDEQWERSFNEGVRQYDTSLAENVRQYDTSLAYQKERDVVADRQWQMNYDEQLRQFNEQMAFQRERANVTDAQWEKTYAAARNEFEAQMAEQKRQFDANLSYNYAELGAKYPSSSKTTNPTNPKPTVETPKPTDTGLLGDINGSKKATTYYAQSSQFYGSDQMYNLLRDLGRVR